MKKKQSPDTSRMSGRARARMEEVDVFDTIKEYLIGEGATEEEALKQMLTLTDEQRTEIIEGSCGSKKKERRLWKMSKFGDLLRGGGAPAPEPVVEEVLITPEEEVLTEASPLEEMNKKELEEYGRTLGIELDRRRSKETLIEELREAEGE